MATGKVTKRTVDALKKSARDQFLWDEDLRGFGLKVTPAGNKVYLIQYRLGGRGSRTRRYTIGTHGSPWTPAGARDEAERLLRLVRQGTDPGADKVERMRVAHDLAFDPYAKQFLDGYVRHKWKASYDFAESILRLHVTPVLKVKPLPLIRKQDITAIFDKLPADKPALRRNVYAVIRRLFRWAIGRGDIETTPLQGFEAPSGAEARDRVLEDWELRLVWVAADELGYPFGPLYRLLIGTGQRREEVSGLDWRELHRPEAEWQLPAARAKNGIANRIHLAPAMIAELDQIAGGEKWPKRGLVFTTTGKTSVSGYSRAKARLDKAVLALARKESTEAGEDPDMIEIAPWRAHDLRRTLATDMQRLDVRFEVTEAILNHVSGSKSGVAGIYQRHDWKAEKRAALNKWADGLCRIVSGLPLEQHTEGNVIALAERRA